MKLPKKSENTGQQAMRRNSIFFLDTNIWISYLLGKQLQHLVRKFLEEEMELITCRELIEEIDGVLKKKNSRNMFRKMMLQSLLLFT